MAKRRPTPMDVPDAVRDAVDRTVQATIGSAQLTRGRAQDAVDELVRTAEARAGAVRSAVVGAFEDRHPATSEDLKELQTELRRISRRLAAIERQLGDGGGGSSAPKAARGGAKGGGKSTGAAGKGSGRGGSGGASRAS